MSLSPVCFPNAGNPSYRVKGHVYASGRPGRCIIHMKARGRGRARSRWDGLPRYIPACVHFGGCRRRRAVKISSELRSEIHVSHGHWFYSREAEQLRRVGPCEKLAGPFPSRSLRRIGIDVGEHLVDVLLAESVQGYPLRDDVPEFLVVALAVGLVGRTVGRGVEDVQEGKFLLQRHDAVEFDAVVREEDELLPGSHVRKLAEQDPQIACDHRRPVALAVDPAVLEALADEHYRQYASFVAGLSLDRVELDHRDLRMLPAEDPVFPHRVARLQRAEPLEVLFSAVHFSFYLCIMLSQGETYR